MHETHWHGYQPGGPPPAPPLSDPAPAAESPPTADEAAPPARRLPGVLRLLIGSSRETRIGLAAALSIAILCGALALNKGRKPAEEPTDRKATGTASRAGGLAAGPKQGAAPKAANRTSPPPPVASLPKPRPSESATREAIAAESLPETPPPPAVATVRDELSPGPEIVSLDPPPPSASEVPPLAAEDELPILPPEPAASEALASAAPEPPGDLLPPRPASRASEPEIPGNDPPQPLGGLPLEPPDPIADRGAARSVGGPPPAPLAAPVPIEATPSPSLSAAGLKPLPNAGRRELRAEQPLGPARPRPAAQVAARPRAAARSAPPADRFGPVRHVVQSGENFWTIARLYYGSGRFHKALWKANEATVRTPQDLHVGDEVRVPAPEQLDARLVEAPRDEPRAVAAAPPRDAQAKRAGQSAGSLVMLPVGRPSRATAADADLEPERPAPSHLVRPRETLRTIARDRLGDARREADIRELNLDQLGEAPTLHPGMRLRLPADAGGETVLR